MKESWIPTGSVLNTVVVAVAVNDPRRPMVRLLTILQHNPVLTNSLLQTSNVIANQ